MKAHTLVLNINRPPITANGARSSHWRKSHAAKREVAEHVALLAQVQQIPALGPTHVTVTWYAPDMRRRDVDALGPFLKSALDSLVDCGVFPDDTWQHIPAVTMKISLDRVRPRLELHLQEVAA